MLTGQQRKSTAQGTVLVAAAMLLSACGAGSTPAPAPAPAPAPTSTPTPGPPASVEREIAPLTTSAAITSNFSSHVAINPDPSVTAKARLFVFLPGTGGVARNYRLILRSGALRGYHAVGITYPNDTAVGVLCAPSADPSCDGDGRREIITGTDLSSLVAINPANSINGRLRALLTYLAATYPAEGWSQYLAAGEPDWSRITVAGHSQGAGHAGYYAKLVSLDRAVMFSGPADSAPGGGPTAWTAMPNITPTARQYGFIHSADNLSSPLAVNANWTAFGLDAFGPPANVDGVSAPYGGSHRLVTSATPNPLGDGITVSPAHNAPAVDVNTPLAPDGTPLFRPVWNYLAFP